ncbi:hypothetical protein [uncultured Chitinophaga sp.]|uniref:DoxX family protein n=1 Tax=uncultured Chitinophaga sp. TaxID=339340 RepID=UPI0025CC7FB1|nr:hypothetical protein [uncultured Chitinophaga sp.]
MDKPSVPRNIARLLLGLILAFAGIGHLTFASTEFHAQVPPWVPFDADLVVLLSGVAELILGVSLLVMIRYRVMIGWIIAAFFVAVFPGNIAQWANQREAFGLNTDTARLIRLFFQPVLVVWALWCTGAWGTWRKREPASRGWTSLSRER